MTSPASLTEADEERLHAAARILDLVARRTDNAAIALHAIAAVEHLTTRIDIANTDASDEEPTSVEDAALLRDALRELSALSWAALRDDGIAEALHQAALAHRATR